MLNSQNIYSNNSEHVNSEHAIDDEYCISLFYSSNKRNSNRMRASWLEKHQDVYNYLLNRYKDSESVAETVYRIKNKIEIRPVCEICGGHLNFNREFPKTCSYSCAIKLDSTKQKIRNTNLSKYGVEYVTQCHEIKEKMKNSLIEHYGVSNPAKSDIIKLKQKENNINKYGVEYSVQRQDVKEKIKNTLIEKYGVNNPGKSEDVKAKIRNTSIKKYGTSWPTKSEKIRKKISDKRSSAESRQKEISTCLFKYGVEHVSQLEEFKNKSYNTKKKNNSFNTSKPEEECYIALLEKYPDTLKQYKSKVYPFLCDYYIPSLDLYIELNCHWTHGKHPFDPLNENDINLVKYWKSKNSKFYNIAINVWTDRDVIKRNTAKKNNLNYIEFWSKSELINYINKERE